MYLYLVGDGPGMRSISLPEEILYRRKAFLRLMIVTS